MASPRLLRWGDHASRSSRRSAASASTGEGGHEPLPSNPRASRARVTSRTGRRGSRARASRSATSWAHPHSRSTRSCPRSRLRRWNQEAPLDRACLFACGLSTGLGAAMKTAVSPTRLDLRCLRRRDGRARRGRGVPAARAQNGSSASTSRRERLELGERAGCERDDTTVGPDTVERILELTGGFGADYTFEATGNVSVMRQAVESARMRWGVCTVAGVAGKGETLDIVPRSPDHGSPRRGLLVRRAQGPRRGAAAR